MKEKQVWDIVRDLYGKYDCKTLIPVDVLRSIIIETTGIYDTGTTTRSLKSLLEADIIYADYGQYRYGKQGRRLLKKFGFIDDDRIDIKPKVELKEGKIENHIEDKTTKPDLPAVYLDDYKKLKQKREAKDNNGVHNTI